MHTFPESFLLLFYQVALGGLFAVAATPFDQLERGFYKSTAGVLFALAVIGLWGKIDLYGLKLMKPGSLAPKGEIFVYVLFVAFFALYLYSLWGSRIVFRARAFSYSLLAGTAGLCLGAQTFHGGSLWSVESLIYPLSFVASAFLLGGVTVGMLIGHWYLIDTGQSLDPFIRIFKFFLLALIGQTCLIAVSSLLLYLKGGSTTATQLQLLWEEHRWLLSTRLLTGLAAPLILSYMIWRTLKIPHTMAATGLFYIALLGVFVGEILGRQILALTALPF